MKIRFSTLAKVGILVAATASLFVVSACKSKPTIKVFLPGEYIGKNTIPNFEKEFGAKVIVENFDSNEMMYTKVQGGDKYDVLIPSDYMIEKLLKEKLLQPLDKAAITNIGELSKDVQNLSYDPDNTYSIPYFWGNIGILYNTKNVPAETVEKEGWSIFHNTKYAGHIYWYDSQRDSFMIALKALGLSANTESDEDIEKANAWLLKMNDTMQPAYVTDEVIDNMTNGLKDIAIVYSGDAVSITSDNPDMAYWVPSEGTNLWYDAMVIPANAENPALANVFINYIISYEPALDNTLTVGYTSPNAKVFDAVTKENSEYAENDAYKPRVGYEKDELFHDNEVIRKKISELWIKVKAHKP